MGRARHPKSYKGNRKPVTLEWKRRAIAKLEGNKRAGRQPANPEQLRAAVKAKKGSMNKLLDLERKPQQNTSAYVDEICAVLEMDPPVFDVKRDEDLERDIEVFSTLPPEERAAYVVLMKQRAR